MEAGQVDLTLVFKTERCYVVPLYQRAYVWGEANWLMLWEDVASAAEEVERSSFAARKATHFLGALVIAEQTRYPRRITPYHIIDGQQRLTTLQVLIASARDTAARHGYPSVGQFAGLLANDREIVHKEHPEDSIPADRRVVCWFAGSISNLLERIELPAAGQRRPTASSLPHHLPLVRQRSQQRAGRNRRTSPGLGGPRSADVTYSRRDPRDKPHGGRRSDLRRTGATVVQFAAIRNVLWKNGTASN